MDPQEIADWREFCEGKKQFSRYHFSRLFMELFLEPLTARDKDDLRTIFSYVPNSARTLEKMLRMDAPADDKSDEEIIRLVRNDLGEMSKIIDSELVLEAIRTSTIKFVVDEERFRRACGCNLNGHFLISLGDYVTRKMSPCDDRVEALSEAFYKLASDLHLQSALTADLIGTDASFDNYFELYLVGVEYALDNEGILVMNYRRLYASSGAHVSPSAGENT